MSSSHRFGCNHNASQNALVLRHNKSNLFFQSNLSHSASSASRSRNSASHSCRQSERKRRGTITPTSAINQSQKRKRFFPILETISFSRDEAQTLDQFWWPFWPGRNKRSAPQSPI